MPRKNFPHRYKQRQVEAAIRQEEYDVLSTVQKISRTVDSPGNSRRQFKRFADDEEE